MLYKRTIIDAWWELVRILRISVAMTMGLSTSSNGHGFPKRLSQLLIYDWFKRIHFKSSLLCQEADCTES